MSDLAITIFSITAVIVSAILKIPWGKRRNGNGFTQKDIEYMTTHFITTQEFEMFCHWVKGALSKMEESITRVHNRMDDKDVRRSLGGEG